MPVPSYTVRCLSNRLIARDIYEFALEKPKELTFKAGQFVLFDVPLVEKNDDIQTRAFSIASAPSEDPLLFVAKMKEGGRASRWIAEMLQEGTEVRLQGPFGFFLLDAVTDKDYLFIGTSTGVAPFRAQIMAALEAGDTRRMDLVFGVRNEDDLFWQKEFEELAQKHASLRVHFALSKPSDAWKGHIGRVQTLVPQIVPDFSRKYVYICGSPDMTKELKQLALEEWNVEKKDLHVEGYI